MSVPIGQTMRLSLEVRIDGTLTDAGSTTVKIRNPVGTTQPHPGTHDGAGLYHFDATFPIAGDWYYRWETTTPTPGVTDDIRVNVKGTVTD